MRQQGSDAGQTHFRELLVRLRDGNSSLEDHNTLMQRTPERALNHAEFENALQLFPTTAAVAEHNHEKLTQMQLPIADIHAKHIGKNAKKACVQEAGGLAPSLQICIGAQIMLTSNLMVESGLVNGTIGEVKEIVYASGTKPPHLPVSVNVFFPKYSGTTLPNLTVPICPITRSWTRADGQCSRRQIPLRLSWAVTIHKAQGMTLDKACICLGEKDFATGISFVAMSRVRKLEDILFPCPFTFQRLKSLKTDSMIVRLEEEKRLDYLQQGIRKETNMSIPLISKRKRNEKISITKVKFNETQQKAKPTIRKTPQKQKREGNKDLTFFDAIPAETINFPPNKTKAVKKIRNQPKKGPEANGSNITVFESTSDLNDLQSGNFRISYQIAQSIIMDESRLGTLLSC